MPEEMTEIRSAKALGVALGVLPKPEKRALYIEGKPKTLAAFIQYANRWLITEGPKFNEPIPEDVRKKAKEGEIRELELDDRNAFFDAILERFEEKKGLNT